MPTQRSSSVQPCEGRTAKRARDDRLDALEVWGAVAKAPSRTPQAPAASYMIRGAPQDAPRLDPAPTPHAEEAEQVDDPGTPAAVAGPSPGREERGAEAEAGLLLLRQSLEGMSKQKESIAATCTVAISTGACMSWGVGPQPVCPTLPCAPTLPP